MIKICVVVAMVLLTQGLCFAQTPPAAPQTVRASGMPLQVNDLPAGTLSVRLVRGAFVEDLSGRVVELQTTGGSARQATTDSQGRATFSVPPGTEVRAFAVIDGENLESNTFQMPPNGGVRVLLVSGGAGDGSAPPMMSGALPEGHPAIDTAAGTTAGPVPAVVKPEDGGRMAVAGLLGGMTIIGGGVVFWRSRRRRTDASADAPGR